jgi:hypothetical protein
MGITPDGGGPLRTEDASIEHRAAPADDLPAELVSTEDDMSASTGTIQRPIGQGSIFGTVALAAVALLAVIAITWGAMSLASTKSVAAPLAPSVVLDKGSRGELAQPVAAPAPGSILDRGSRDDLSPKAVLVPYAAGKPGNVTPQTFGGQPVHTNHPRHLAPFTPPRGARAS